MREHHARWRAALIDSLHEAFFLADAHGAVVEINAAFADMLGYGAEGLPYPAPHPWWPSRSRPGARRMAEEAYGGTRGRAGGASPPFTHRDGHRLWVAGSFSEVNDPDNGRRWSARSGTSPRSATPCSGTGPGRAWACRCPRASLAERCGRRSTSCGGSGAPARRRGHLGGRGRAGGTASVRRPAGAAARALAGCAIRAARAAAADPGVGARRRRISLEYPTGSWPSGSTWARARTLTGEDRTLLACCAAPRAGTAPGVPDRPAARDGPGAAAGDPRPGELPAGFSARYEPASRPLEVGGDWYDIVELPDGRIASWSATASGTSWAPPA